MTFAALVVLLSLVSAGVILIPLLGKSDRLANPARRDVNLDIARSGYADLLRARENGEIDESRFHEYQRELEVSLYDELRDEGSSPLRSSGSNKAMIASILLLLPLASIVVYDRIGSGEALRQISSASSDQPADNQYAQEIESVMAAVEQSLQDNPGDVEGRIALARVYFDLERFSEAANIFRELNELRPNEPDILVNYAEALARSHADRLTGLPRQLLNQALQVAPNHGRALWLAGFAELQAGNRDTALKLWQHLLEGLEPDNSVYQQVDAMIRELRRDSGAVIDDARKPMGGITGSISPAASIEVSVSLSPALTARLKPGATLFVFARANAGPPMPLAVYRGRASQLPLTVTLDDSMAMMPEMKLSSFTEITVAARLSTNGQPQGRPGDLEGFAEKINLRDTARVDLVIDSIKP